MSIYIEVSTKSDYFVFTLTYKYKPMHNFVVCSQTPTLLQFFSFYISSPHCFKEWLGRWQGTKPFLEAMLTQTYDADLYIPQTIASHNGHSQLFQVPPTISTADSAIHTGSDLNKYVSTVTSLIFIGF